LKCRHCDKDLALRFIDLGNAPPSNAYLPESALQAPERYYPLRVLVCPRCWLAQTEDYAGREELFASDYAYFSSYSSTWLEHAQAYVKDMVVRLGLTEQSCVVEVAANDGYLLQYIRERGIPCYGIEPTANTAAAARSKGIEIVEEFFSVAQARRLAAEGRQADLIIANNVLAHVPDINDFVSGFACLLKQAGVATFEFPHLLRLVQGNQFDTIYHEHYSYLSLTAVKTIFMANGLELFDVEELPTHGGSLRVFAQRRDAGTKRTVRRTVASLLGVEERAGMLTPAFYRGFQQSANRVKNDLLAFLLDAYRQGKTIAAYGAAAKGNTLLNYAGIRPDLLPYVVDKNPAKQGKYLPGSHIPVVSEDKLRESRPDYVLILPWNLKQEIAAQLSYVSGWGGRFVTAVPQLGVWAKE
jgi:SAM-dependent methyltransferase